MHHLPPHLEVVEVEQATAAMGRRTTLDLCLEREREPERIKMPRGGGVNWVSLKI
jgi:hypothetical protein